MEHEIKAIRGVIERYCSERVKEMDKKLVLALASKLMEIAENTVDVNTQDELNTLAEQIFDALS